MPVLTVAQSSASSSTSVIAWSFVLIGMIIVGFILVAGVKKRLRSDEASAPGAAAGFTLSDLRQMHREAQLTDDEFQRAKEKILGAAKSAPTKNGDPGPPDN